MKSLFEGLSSLMDKYESLETIYMDMPYSKIIRDKYTPSVYSPMMHISIPLSPKCNYTPGDKVSSVVIVKLRKMKEVAFCKFESNPEGQVIYRVVSYK